MPRKKERPEGSAGSRKGDAFMKQMGLLGDGIDNSDSDDEDLEAELLRLEGKNPGEKLKPKSKKAPSLSVIEKLAADIDTEITSDTELSGDEDELMKELENLSSEEEKLPAQTTMDSASLVRLLEERCENYRQAISCSDGSKKKRCERALKALQGLLRSAKAGKPVDESEIPPPVRVDAPPMNLTQSPTAQPTQQLNLSPSEPTVKPTPQPKLAPTGLAAKPAAPAPPMKPAKSIDPQTAMLMERRDQYHVAALEAKRQDNQALAKQYLRTQKDFDRVIEAVREGKEVDLSNIPPPPSHQQGSMTRDTLQGAAGGPTGATATGDTGSSFLDKVEDVTEREAQSLFNAPEGATDTMGALMQRLQKYKESENAAKEGGNTRKANRMGRIAKQYQDAIKSFKAGKPTDFSELPDPPGFAPIPLPSASKTPVLTASPVVTPLRAAAAGATGPSTGLGVPQNAPGMKRSPSPSARTGQQAEPAKAKPKRQASLSIQEKQLTDLKSRQASYKKAALDAKTHDDRELALKYLRIAKGMDPMISAATNGLPVDMSQIPPPPMAEHHTGFVVVDKADIADVSPEDRQAEFKKVEQELKNQIQSSVRNAQYFKKIGDLKNEFKFQNLEQNCRKDLDSLKNAFTHNDPVPKYHYETRQYSTIVCNTELGDSDLEVSIIRGIQYPMPPEIKEVKHMDTMVYFEFPFPQDEGQKGHTDYCKHSDNPEYEFTTKLRIERKSKSMQRVFKNKKLRLELFYKRGFLKADKHFATVTVKLDALEAKATVHESFDLCDTNGRKEIGGKLEVKLRMREPLSQKQVEIKQEKWLVIDQFVRTELPVHTNQKSPQPNRARAPLPQVKIQSIEVLKFDKKELDIKIRQVANQLTPNDLERLTRKSTEIASNIEAITSMMKRNQLSVHEYIQHLSNANQTYHKEIMAANQTGDRKRMQLLTAKKDILSREIRAWQMRQKM